MNDKKKLAIFVAAMVVVIAAAAVVYNSYRDRVDPETGVVTGAADAQTRVLGASVEAAPDFAMQDADGNTVKLSDFKGKPVVLNFWTSWCAYCKSEMPYFQSAYRQYGGDVQFIMMNAVKSEKESGDGKDYIADSDYTFPVYYETAGKAETLYGVRGFPATVFIDAEGNIVAKNLGSITKGKLNKNIAALLAE